MTSSQRRHHQYVAEILVSATGKTIAALVGHVENPRILRRTLKLETEMTNGRPRLRVKRAVERRLLVLKRLSLQTCRYCGCTDNDGCQGGCCWVKRNVCSRCAKP